MGRRLRAKNQKRRKDLHTAYKKGEWPIKDKVAEGRSRTALKKKAYRSP